MILNSFEFTVIHSDRFHTDDKNKTKYFVCEIHSSQA